MNVSRGLICMAVCMAAAFAAPVARAQDFPQQTVTILVPNAAGGPPDVIARLLATGLSEIWSRPVIVENHDGANGALGAMQVARGTPDGHLLMLTTSGTMVGLPAMAQNPQFDSEADFTPIAYVGHQTMVLAAHPSVEANDVGEFIEYARANPGALRHGLTGASSVLSAAYFFQAADIEVLDVNYNSSMPGFLATVAGEVDFTLSTPATTMGHYHAGQVKLLGVTSRERSSLLPDVPTFIEGGLEDFEYTIWYGLFAPAGLPEKLVAQINEAVVGIVESDAFIKRLAALSIEPSGSTPEELAAILNRDLTITRKIVRAAGIPLR
ncbi:Bug family tripartite tricarboxylate transporter substrate binding protein [Pseudochelatococcus sp. B33]